MNIDERLEALTRRHEALTESVELLLLQSREHSPRLDRVGERLDQVGERLDQVGKRLDQVGQHVEALVQVAELHHARLSRLEDSQSPL